ncbi:MAG: crossover junction endodeoxyribonuclease RuvC [Rhodovibrionaceae bacterium]|nr:crossover junction endodeoxyribonuclease RuvC [Rhodovibrionaceae bacterium]
MRVIGLDPGLRRTGWGVIDAEGARLSHVANGVVDTDASDDLAQRLLILRRGIAAVVAEHAPQEAAVEVSLANKNPDSTLKLGMARGISLMVPAEVGLPVAEYLPMIVKKSVVGTGHAAKEQVQMMIARLLPGCEIAAADAADALAVAVCHAHHAATGRSWAKGVDDPLAALGGKRR